MVDLSSTLSIRAKAGMRPAFVEAEDAGMQSDAHLVWMDLEMTGLDPERDTILEIATLITTNELQLVARGAGRA